MPLRGFGGGRRRRASLATPAAAAPDDPGVDAVETDKGLDREALARLAAEAWKRRDAWALAPDALLEDPAAAEALRVLRRADPRSGELAELLEWAQETAAPGADYVVIALVLELLAAQEIEASLRPHLVSLASFGPREPLHPYALRVIGTLERLGPPLLDDLVLGLPPSWGDDAALRAALIALVIGLLDAGDDLHPERLPPWRRDEPPPSVAILERAAAGADDRQAPRLARVASRLALTGEPLGYVRAHGP